MKQTIKDTWRKKNNNNNNVNNVKKKKRDMVNKNLRRPQFLLVMYLSRKRSLSFRLKQRKLKVKKRIGTCTIRKTIVKERHLTN